MTQQPERDYVLGTNDEELARLGLQHRVWRARVLECWRRAGIQAGWRVADVGAGPGYATVDLAEIVGPSGEVIALERSVRFIEAAQKACQERGLANVRFRQMDLVEEQIGALNCDAAWCRWLSSFVSSPAKLVANIAGALAPGGLAIFHEYVHYESWRRSPHGARHDEFVNEVMASWRATGGEPNVARMLPTLLVKAGFALKHVTPLVLAVRPGDFEWQWPATFIEINLRRLVELKRVSQEWADEVRGELREAERDPVTVMITPMVLEIIAQRTR
jgi:ubiquinone/menaquinone biosynthesis C-methylase UbiE